MSEIRDALRMVRDREPVELGEGVTPDRVVKLALDVLDLGYRAHGENARASLPAVQIDWIMQRWADAEERAATADRDASDYATAMDARMDDAVEMTKLTAERDAAEAEVRRVSHNCDQWRQNSLDASRAADRLAAENNRLRLAFHDAIRRPLGVTPDSGAEFYEPRMADEAEARRAARPSSPTTGGAA